MAVRYNALDVLDMLDCGDFGLPEEEDSDYEGEEIQGYLPEVSMDDFEEDEEDEVSDEDGELLAPPESHFGLQEGSVDHSPSKYTL